MLEFKEIRNNKEISRLIEFGYDLHSREMEYASYGVPNFKYYYRMKQIKKGGIFGKRNFPNHSESFVCTTLGVCIGKNKRNKFDVKYAQMIQTDNKSFNVYFTNLKFDDKNFELVRDEDNSWIKMKDDEKIESFIKTMEYVGFRREDVVDVLNGRLTARQAYMNVAPNDIKNFQWVNKSRRIFVFDGNVAIQGEFGSMDMDDFPFPFEGQPILDCSKVNTCCINFGENYRRVKLINVNSNPKSIRSTNLKNAIIEEPIDLYKVDATYTKFGHQTVFNLFYSKARIADIDLTLALNEDGERFVVDENGVVQYYDIFTPKTIPNNDKLKNIKVLANSDNYEMAIEVVQNEIDGIGLVRTENIFKELEDVKGIIKLLYYPSEEDKVKYLSRLKELQKKQVVDILSVIQDKPIIFRLLDFNLKDNLKKYDLNLDFNKEYVDQSRGTYFLKTNKNIFIVQLEAIFEVISQFNTQISLLIPFFKSVYDFEYFKKEILQLSQKYNLTDLKIGAMIENIETANNVDEIAKYADFISIGTNDLTESITGLNREIDRLEFQKLTESVKQTIEEIIYRARVTNPDIKIGICGEHSNYIENVLFYKELDIDYITCNSSFVKTNKEILESDTSIKKEKVKKLN